MSLLLIVAIFASDPKLEFFWTARADYSPPPANGSTDIIRVTFFAYDFESRLAQINSPEGYINYEYDAATGRHTRTCTANSEFTYQYDALGRLWKVNVLKRNGSTVSETRPMIIRKSETESRSRCRARSASRQVMRMTSSIG